MSLLWYAWEFLFGEQDVRGKHSILQVNLIKELNGRTGNNQYKFLSELFGSGLEVKNVYFAPGQ